MKKVLFGVFAHPDDEGFGPSGTLYKAVQDGTEVNLILVTDGAASTNHETNGDLAHDRLHEWRASGVLIGAHDMRALNYPDGRLSNSLYLEVAEKIIRHIKAILEPETDTEVELMTFEPGGISGHLDHVAISHITTYVYLKLRDIFMDSPVRVGNLRYFCLPETLAAHANTDWLYMPKGVPLHMVDEVVDITDVYEKKLEIMRCHKSQKADMEMILQNQSHLPDFKSEHFIYYK